MYDFKCNPMHVLQYYSTNIVIVVLGTLVTDALSDYITRYSPVYPGVEGRITFVYTGSTMTTEGNSGTDGTTKKVTHIPYCPDMDYTNEASSLFVQQNRIVVLPIWITIVYISIKQMLYY